MQRQISVFADGRFLFDSPPNIVHTDRSLQQLNVVFAKRLRLQL